MWTVPDRASEKNNWNDGRNHGDIDTVDDCVGCDKGKMKNRPFKHLKKSLHADAGLHLVHTDVSGPFIVKSLRRWVYFQKFVYDHWRMTFVYFLRHKSELDRHVRDFAELADCQTGNRDLHLRSGNAGEYGSSDPDRYLRQRGIVLEKTEPYTPQQDGVAEMTNTALMDNSA